MSFAIDGARVDCWYRNDISGGLWYRYSDDPYCETWSDPVAIVIDGEFPSVLAVNSTYYMTVVRGGNLYLYTSTDKLNWLLLNDGDPVLEKSASGSDWSHQLFNSSITIDDGGTWHLLIEGKAATGPFQLGYSYSTFAEGPNFNGHLTPTPIISATAGNPFVQFVPDRAALLLLYGDVSTSTWRIRAKYGLLSSDLTQASSWVPAYGFGLQQNGVHVSDPTFVVNTGEAHPWKMLFGYNYDQLDGYQGFNNLTLNEFYDLVVDPLNSQAGLAYVGSRLRTNAIDFGPFQNCSVEVSPDGDLFFRAALSSAGTMRPVLALMRDGKIGVGTESPIDQLSLSGQFGDQTGYGELDQLLVVAANPTTDTAFTIPANVIVLSVAACVVEEIPGTSTMRWRGTDTDKYFNTGGSSAGMSTAENSSDAGTFECPYWNPTAQHVRFVPNTTPSSAAGRVRVVARFIRITPPAN
jgi:hypothetical protein